MTPSGKLLASAFGALRDAGFAKKGMVWCRRTAETVFSFELQKSSFDDRYFVNAGAWFLELGEAEHLPPRRCHVYGRFGGREIEAALDFVELPATDRLRALQEFRGRELLPLADRARTVSGVAEALRAGLIRVPLVRPEARALLGLEP